MLLVAGYAFRDKAVEQWYIWKLDSINEPEREVATEKLAQMRSIRAVPKLARIFLDHPPPDYSVRALFVRERAAEALKKIQGESSLMKRRGKRLSHLTVILGLLILVAAGFAAKVTCPRESDHGHRSPEGD